MTGKMVRRSFDKQFKISVINLVLNSGRSVTSAAKDLGVSGNAFILFPKIAREFKRIF